jgi:hypothetical protein
VFTYVLRSQPWGVPESLTLWQRMQQSGKERRPYRRHLDIFLDSLDLVRIEGILI